MQSARIAHMLRERLTGLRSRPIARGHNVLTLPLRKSAQLYARGRREKPMDQSTAVIVEDEPLFAQALAAFLEDLGYQVLATVDTEQGAVDVVRERRPDVVLMDIKLIGGSGINAAIAIRESSEVPIVFCTSYATDSAVRVAVQALGNAALIGKPFDEDEFADLLAKAVRNGSVTPSPSPVSP
jgi:CheY-like chemotaxis protein